MVPFRVPIMIRHLLFRVPNKDLNFNNYPHGMELRTAMTFVTPLNGKQYLLPALLFITFDYAVSSLVLV